MILTKQKPVEQSPLVECDIEEPHAGTGELRLKVSACATCRTDIHIAEGDLELHKVPLILGHQIVGRIDQIGSGLTNRRVGDRIGVGWLRHVDGTCEFCARGRENLCRESRYTGYDADGGYAEYAVVPDEFAYDLPNEFDDEQIAPLLCGGLIGYRALERATVPKNGRLLLVGFGRSAHIVIQLAVARGHEVYVVTRSENHLREARSLGAACAGADFRDLPAKMHSAILFAPVGKLVPPIMEALDRGGVCAIAGIHLSEIPALDYSRHLFQERELRSVTANTRDDARALLAEAAAAKIRPRTSSYSLGEANRALADMEASRSAGTPVLIP
ncbi:MAG TPA: zinc-binding alcohol dehydrogenase family protein [Chthoniobacterales bacterium]|jgi:propanol-preferring alcohol dehydrogenase